MANERSYIKDKSGRTVAHIDTIGNGEYYNYVVDGITREQIIPRAGGRWYDENVMVKDWRSCHRSQNMALSELVAGHVVVVV